MRTPLAGSVDLISAITSTVSSMVKYLYNTGRVDTTLPLEELRRRSRINQRLRIVP
jgi:hypothetical protein